MTKIDKSSFVYLSLCFFPFVENVMNPEYVLSRFGKLMLIHNGYRLTMNRKPVIIDGGTKTYWKCTVGGGSRKRCKATAATYRIHGIESAVFKSSHYHPPPKAADYTHA